MSLALRTQHAALRHLRHHPAHGKPEAARPRDDGRLLAALGQAGTAADSLLAALKDRLGTAELPEPTKAAP